ncbi:TRAUB-domain-containing protein [Aureobasidium sp. EXF-12298]|nr:TRAUB-domain-containing protein [Aureobasidium sp. EXF-12298]KAI4761736.1 TRAUB-domain-containing protein [Aureobasidium sp. EXF-12344]KAI4779010.1 TRAUB-domain-containing protein [Aureobasidium sp. EXF-3400]
MARRTKTLAEQLAELDNPAPKDFDPEEEPPQDDSDDDVSDNDNAAAAREHYVDVGKSKLRKRDVVPLGPRYEGARISRDAAIGEDEDEDDPFSKGFDEEDSEEEDDIDDAAELSASEEGGDDVSDEDEDMHDGDESPATDMSDEDDEEEDDEDDEAEDKSELRKMMAEEQKTVAASLSQAAKQDAEKGRAVKTQRATFDSLLNTRIKLQKALIGTNTLTGVISDSTPTGDTEDAFRAAETAAFTLWSTLNSLRETLESNRTGSKRKHVEYTLDTPTEDLWSHMRSQEASVNSTRVSILEKWNQKARGASAITPKNKLNNSSANQSIVDVLQEQLHGDRLTKRARTPRSCAPLQLAAASTTPASETPAQSIYDDADFYGLLLQSLLEQRSADSIAASASSTISINSGFQMRREAKTKKNVDTKASKGRKMRYTVQEKLQNFMAPEDRGTWAERAADELFGSLFGARMGLGEDEDEQEQEEENEDEEAGLMMFRS